MLYVFYLFLVICVVLFFLFGWVFGWVFCGVVLVVEFDEIILNFGFDFFIGLL